MPISRSGRESIWPERCWKPRSDTGGSNLRARRCWNCRPTVRDRRRRAIEEAGERVEIGKEVSEGLKRLSRREGATLFMTLMAAFKALLMRYSGQEDISCRDGDREPDAERNGRIDRILRQHAGDEDGPLGGNPSFRELMKREREVALGAYAHQDVPFEKLVEEINPERDLSRSPLFQVMMALQNTRQGELEMSGLKVSGMGERDRGAKFDLTLI